MSSEEEGRIPSSVLDVVSAVLHRHLASLHEPAAALHHPETKDLTQEIWVREEVRLWGWVKALQVVVD